MSLRRWFRCRQSVAGSHHLPSLASLCAWQLFVQAAAVLHVVVIVTACPSPPSPSSLRRWGRVEGYARWVLTWRLGRQVNQRPSPAWNTDYDLKVAWEGGRGRGKVKVIELGWFVNSLIWVLLYCVRGYGEETAIKNNSARFNYPAS